MTDREKQFEKALNDFQDPVRKILQTIPEQAGRLSAPQCVELMTHLKIDAEELLIRLLPLAKLYAVVPVSQFQVGAVAMADSFSNEGRYDIFLGANLEFMHQPLNQSIHAEQSATMNAWHQGAGYLKAIATSETPCGHCRQFLYEFEKNADLMVITLQGKNRAYRKTALSDLLPEAFGPLDLSNRSGLMSPEPPNRKLRLPIKTRPSLRPCQQPKNHMRPIPKILRVAQFKSKAAKLSAAVMQSPRPSTRA